MEAYTAMIQVQHLIILNLYNHINSDVYFLTNSFKEQETEFIEVD